MRRLLFLTAVLAVGLFAAPACWAAPSISIIDDGMGTATVQITIDAPGSLGAEIAVELYDPCSDTPPGVEVVTAEVNTDLFDTPNPGDNPFIPGSPVQGDSTGLWLDPQYPSLFASFGSSVLQEPGTYNFLTLEYFGAATTQIQATGYVAQDGVLGDFLDTGAIGDPICNDGILGPAQLAAIGINWDPEGVDGPYSRSDGDYNGDDTIGPADLAYVGINWNPTGAALAVPEPSTALLLALAGGSLLATRGARVA